MQNVINYNTVFMNTAFKRILLILPFLLIVTCHAPGGIENSVVLIKTTFGDIRIKLYDGTPIHRDNFIKLVNMGFYDGVSFHRIIKDFMIQAGDPATRTGLSQQQIDTLSTYTIPSEFRKEYYHKKGAIAAAREGNEINPEMRSSGTQFYIVQGKKYTRDELKVTEQRINSNIKQSIFSKIMKEIADSTKLLGELLTESEIQEQASLKMFEYLTTVGEFSFFDEQIDTYMNSGGTPRLDATYTVFGEVTEGLEIVDMIASVETGPSDKPLNEIKILSMKLVNK